MYRKDSMGGSQRNLERLAGVKGHSVLPVLPSCSRAGAPPSRRSGCVRRYTAGQTGNWIRFYRRRKIAACMRRWGIGIQVKRRWSMRDLPWCFMRKSGNSDGYAKLYKAGGGRGDDSGLRGLSAPCLGQPGFCALNGGQISKMGFHPFS